MGTVDEMLGNFRAYIFLMTFGDRELMKRAEIKFCLYIVIYSYLCSVKKRYIICLYIVETHTVLCTCCILCSALTNTMVFNK